MLLAAINWHSFFFLFFALLACGFAVGVLVSTNIVRMAFYLVMSLSATAGLFFLAGAEFVGAMQLMIYVGGTMVLLIFGVMLTARERFIDMQTPGGQWVLAAAAGGLFFFILVVNAFQVPDWSTPNPHQDQLSIAESKTTTQIGAAFVGVRLDRPEADNATQRAGMSGYLLPFEIVSVHLLVVLIGAAYLARAKRRVDQPGS